MLFNSYIFIFVFLPLTLGSYYGLHKLGKPVFAKVALILMSFWFYGYFNPSYLWIMCSSIVINYLLSQFLQRRWGGTISKGQLALLKKALLGIGLIFNLGLIFYFKYYDFFVDNRVRSFCITKSFHSLRTKTTGRSTGTIWRAVCICSQPVLSKKL